MNAETPDLGSFQMSSQVACDLSDRIAAFDPRFQYLRQSDDLGRGTVVRSGRKSTFLDTTRKEP